MGRSPRSFGLRVHSQSNAVQVTEDKFDKRTTGPLEKGLEDILLGKDLIEYRKVRQGMDKYKGPYDESPPELLALKRQYLGFCFDAIDDIGPLRDSGRGDTVIDFEEMTMILEDDMDESKDSVPGHYCRLARLWRVSMLAISTHCMGTAHNLIHSRQHGRQLPALLLLL